jgi:hypothetical protein
MTADAVDSGVGPTQAPDCQIVLRKNTETKKEEEAAETAEHSAPGNFGGAGTPEEKARDKESFINYQDSAPPTPAPPIPLVDLTRGTSPQRAEMDWAEESDEERTETAKAGVDEEEEKRVVDRIMIRMEDIYGRYESRALARHNELVGIMRADFETAIHTLQDNNLRVMTLLESERMAWKEEKRAWRSTVGSLSDLISSLAGKVDNLTAEANRVIRLKAATTIGRSRPSIFTPAVPPPGGALLRPTAILQNPDRPAKPLPSTIRDSQPEPSAVSQPDDMEGVVLQVGGLNASRHAVPGPAPGPDFQTESVAGPMKQDSDEERARSVPSAPTES